MKTILTILLLSICITVQANDPTLEKLKLAVKPGNKVYIVAEKDVMVKYAAKQLKKSCWEVTPDLSKANFVLKFEGGGWFAKAGIYDPATKEQLYKIPVTNTMASMTFNAKKKVVKKIIGKHVLPMCDPSYFDKMEFKSEF